MKLGADRKKLAMLGGLVLIGGYVVWTNVFSGSDSSNSPASTRAVATSPIAAATEPAVADGSGTSTRHRGSQSRGGDWELIYKDPKKAIDPSKVDPTLHLELLAKVQQVAIGSAQRDLFRFGDAPKPVVITDNKPMPRVPPIAMGQQAGGPAGGGPPQPPMKPQPPAIQLKYYGYANPRNNVTRKRAFFLDGEDIIVASEGDLINKRYKLVKIGVNSVTMEDTQFNNQQQLPLAQDVAT